MVINIAKKPKTKEFVFKQPNQSLYITLSQ